MERALSTLSLSGSHDPRAPITKASRVMSDRMVGRSRFHAEYWMRSGPGAEFAFILLVVLDTSSASLGASMTSVWVGLDKVCCFTLYHCMWHKYTNRRTFYNDSP